MADLNDPQVNGSSSRVVRAAVAVLAVVAIAFCGWSAWEYSQGNDPLAFLGGGAFQTVEEGSGASSAQPAQQIEVASNTVTADDVTSAIAGLAFEGNDVSVPADGVAAVISDDGVWVEQATTDDAPAMVEATARRAAALATWAGEQNVGLAHVTWISEDANGAVRMVVRFACAGVPTTGDEAALLGASEGYAISGDAYAELGESPAFAQSSGEAPTLPDASAVAVVAQKTAEGEVLTQTKTVYRVVDENGKEVSSKNSRGGSSDGSGTANGSAAAGGAGSNQGSTITVSITVDGSAAGAGSSSATLTLPAGATVYDALAATGVSFNAKSTGYGMYVTSIGGLAEKEHGGMSGWMYSVNGSAPNVSCSSYTLSGGESIYWWYANVTE
mgnify:CR=1 FL=1